MAIGFVITSLQAYEDYPSAIITIQTKAPVHLYLLSTPYSCTHTRRLVTLRGELHSRGHKFQ